MTGEVKGKYVKGKYRGKAINALVKNGVITRFEYQDDKGKWFYPLIVDGQNVEKDIFELEVAQMAKIELDVLFKKLQKDDKKEILEFHIIDDEVPHATELIEMAGNMAALEIGEHEKLNAEFKKIQRDSKKTVLQFEPKGDNQDKLIKLYKVAGSHVKLTLEASQMSIEDFEDKDPGLSYNVNKDGTVDVHENQMSIDEVAAEIDEDDLLN